METPDDFFYFRFIIGGYHGNNTEIRTRQNELLYLRSSMPFGEQWFLEQAKPQPIDTPALREILTGCLQWQNNYVNDVLDGCQWTLLIIMNGHRREMHGSNVYPENFFSLVSELERLIQKPLL